MNRLVILLIALFILLLLICAGTLAAVPLPIALSITTPATYQVFQRDIASNTGSIVISGYADRCGNPQLACTAVLRDITHSVSASWGGYQRSWAVTSNVFQVSFDHLPAGQHTLTVTVDGNTVSVLFVGIGDVYVIAGQSNAVGAALHFQRYTPYQGLRAVKFSRALRWEQLIDPLWGSMGSYWPLLATYILRNGLPVAFIPAASGHTSVIDWQAGGSYYTAMKTRLLATRQYGNTGRPLAAGVLWVQGETDARNGMSSEVYLTYLNSLAQSLWDDFQLPLFATRLHHMRYATQPHLDAINAAIDSAVTMNEHIFAGADFSPLYADDVAHLRTDANQRAAALRWYQALVNAGYYPS